MDLQFTKECDNCNETFEVTREQVTFCKAMKCVENGKLLMLTYYKCPKCGKVFVSQIDNAETYQLRKQVTAIAIKISAKKQLGKDVPQKQSSKAKKMNIHLDELRNKLKEKYTGKSFVDIKTGEAFKNIEVHNG